MLRAEAAAEFPSYALLHQRVMRAVPIAKATAAEMCLRLEDAIKDAGLFFERGQPRSHP